MKSILLIIILSLSACAQLKSPTLSKEEVKKRIAESQTQNVIQALEQKPVWLFTGDVCPAVLMPDIEKKIEYKAEGCADNPDNCLKKCRADDANACYALSLLLDEQRGKEDANSQALYLRACKLGIVSGCTNNAAGKLSINSEDEKIAKCAADTFEKTCARDDSWGCTMYGESWALGLGRPENVEEALKYFQKACAKFGNDAPACQSARKSEEMLKKIEQTNKTLKKPTQED